MCLAPTVLQSSPVRSSYRPVVICRLLHQVAPRHFIEDVIMTKAVTPKSSAQEVDTPISFEVVNIVILLQS